MRSILVIAVVLLIASGAADAQIGQKMREEGKDPQKTFLYQWIDDKGITHVTDNLGNVPMKYRKKATTIEQTPEEKGPAQGPPRVSESRRPTETAADEEYAKEEWQQRMKDAQQRLADVQRRYQELDRKRTEALGKWGGVASGMLAGRIEAERIEQEMKQVQKEIDNARNQVEVVIPEQARKAGVPPGWLRE